MQAAFTILPIFACVFALASGQSTTTTPTPTLVYKCKDYHDGAITSHPHKSGIRELPMSKGGLLRIYVAGTEDLDIVGASIRFCDEQIDQVKIELADDGKSYIVQRATDSSSPSSYTMIAYENRWETAHPPTTTHKKPQLRILPITRQWVYYY